jgi:hypothetical protein
MPDRSSTILAQQDTATPERVSQLIEQFTALWWQSGGDPPALGRSYSVEEQQLRETQLERFQNAVRAEGKSAPRTAGQRQAAKERILSAFRGFASSALDFSEEHLSALLDHGFPEAGQEFAQAARRFDPAIRGSDIFQAMRNVWTMNGIQALLDVPIRLTPAMFAYSMLYPYTDNYLDDPAVPTAAKRAFNERFAARLAGQEVPASNAQEGKIHDLVGMVEGHLERGRYPQVYDSLLAIHQAQCRSIGLVQRNASPYELDVLGISLDKGGTSVLADGYLVAGTLTRAQAEYIFGWGAFVQFVDDLQDVEEDGHDGLATVFSVTAGRWPLDAITNRTFDFGRQVVERLACFDAPGAEPMKQMMRSTVFRMMVEAVGHAAQFYGKPYVQEMEAHSPFRFSFLSQRRGMLAGQSAPFMSLLEAFARADARP